MLPTEAKYRAVDASVHPGHRRGVPFGIAVLGNDFLFAERSQPSFTRATNLDVTSIRRHRSGNARFACQRLADRSDSSHEVVAEPVVTGRRFKDMPDWCLGNHRWIPVASGRKLTELFCSRFLLTYLREQ
jgi:hypothetical protein